MTVNLLIIATNNYIQFLPGLLESVHKYFLKDCKVIINVFTDRPSEVKRMVSEKPYHINAFKIWHKEWPYVTMMRYHFFNEHLERFHKSDYCAYIDVDTLIMDNITKEILSPITAVQHCGYVGRRGTYETNPQSASFVPPDQGTYYFGGGFWLFGKIEFVVFIRNAVYMTNHDIKKGITPKWHDESVLNKYLTMFPPKNILSPSYHYPEGNTDYYKGLWGKDYPCKILLLDKRHEELR